MTNAVIIILCVAVIVVGSPPTDWKSAAIFILGLLALLLFVVPVLFRL